MAVNGGRSEPLSRDRFNPRADPRQPPMRIPVRPDDLQTAGEPRAEVHDLSVPVLLGRAPAPGAIALPGSDPKQVMVRLPSIEAP